MGNSIDFTTVVAVDNQHLPELIVSHSSWARNQSQILRSPMLLVCDASQGDHDRWRKSLGFVFRRQLASIVLWDMPQAVTQREKMLTALVHAPASHVTTDWYLKLDTDSIATCNENLYEPEWFADDPAFISLPWSYTKPAEYIMQCEAWADRIDPNRILNRPAFTVSQDGKKAFSKRIISYVFFGKTSWAKKASDAVNGGQLPCPSQDTYSWYFAEMHSDRYRTVRFNKRGWSHGAAAVRQYASKGL